MPEARPARILLVEDNEINIMIFSDLLSAAGYQVLTARTAEESLAIARAQAPDLVLMDLQLPGMDGLEAIRLLKSEEGTRAIPVAALTAHAMPAHREKAMAAGCCGYITKPIRVPEFREEVEAMLRSRKSGS